MMTVAIPAKIESDPWDGYFSTKTVWDYPKPPNKSSVDGKPYKTWVCFSCGKEPKSFYMCRHRYDETVCMCNCRGARRVGLDSFDLEKTEFGCYLKQGHALQKS
jgi:hypothetical protein